MRPLRKVLSAFTKPEIYENGRLTGRQFAICHFPIASGAPLHLYEFLHANMDEQRLFHAQSYTDAVLELTDHEDANYFRRGVLSREISGDMDFENQGDHTAHTLNNYLLGWFIFCYSSQVALQMQQHLQRRFADDRDRSICQQFGNIWPIASLLHDVGYLFEGGLNALETDTQVPKATKGARYVDDFFQGQFWKEIDLSAASLRSKITALTGVTAPAIRSESLNAISDSLRALGGFRNPCSGNHPRTA